MKSKLAVVTFALLLGVTLDAAAQAKPEVLVKQRQAAMTLQGKYLGPLGAMAQGKAPFNAQIVQRNAGYLEVLSKMPWDGFDPSTKGEKSAALPAVWEKAGEFKQAQERFENEAAKLVQVAKSGDEGAIKAQIGATAKSCGGCHENFRQKN
ncbi:MAG TPA: cytochrome c [Burkholderiales bacterium]|nr:cytochrome c [Burkholderiales bacterium]HXJ09301.1 cytochrome c [Burkholderiales bacterium]